MARLHGVDPQPLQRALGEVDGVARTVPEMLRHIEAWTTSTDRNDLANATRWLLNHPIEAGEDVICHGDLHPFNMVIDERGGVTVLDWSAAVLAPRALDVAFTSLLLSNPPLEVPGRARPVLAGAGRALAHRFLARYRHHTGYAVDSSTLAWYQAVVCVRALAEAASWVHDDALGGRAGHPWLLSGTGFAKHLAAVTGVRVRAL
ncbi:MAG: phosphotransferase [Actinobacteria bacterium]|nr:phosphotransferase [Actinomycetota bacterium]MBV9255372.1 phosphotransferase [Actinomycetota bacterium]